MKALTFSRLCLMGTLILGLFIAWDACLGQAEDIGTLVGRCTYSCGNEPCDYHAVSCDDKKDQTCPTDSEGCCRGPDTGDGECNPRPGTQCDETGCVPRGEEDCVDWP